MSSYVGADLPSQSLLGPRHTNRCLTAMVCVVRSSIEFAFKFCPHDCHAEEARPYGVVVSIFWVVQTKVGVFSKIFEEDK